MDHALPHFCGFGHFAHLLEFIHLFIHLEDFIEGRSGEQDRHDHCSHGTCFSVRGDRVNYTACSKVISGKENATGGDGD